MKDTHYTHEELALLGYVETNPKSVANVKERIAFIKNAVSIHNHVQYSSRGLHPTLGNHDFNVTPPILL